MLEHIERFLLAPMEAHEQLVERVIAGAQREDPVEPASEPMGGLW
jgi:hypothetical protein